MKRWLGPIGSIVAIVLTLGVYITGLLLSTPSIQLPGILANHNYLILAGISLALASIVFQEGRTQLQTWQGLKKLREYKLTALGEMLSPAREHVASAEANVRIWVYRIPGYFRYLPFKNSPRFPFKQLVTISPIAATVPSYNYISCRPGEGIAGRVMDTKLSYSIDLDGKDNATIKSALMLTEQQLQLMRGTKSGAGYPIFDLKSRNRLIGVLVIDSRQTFLVSKLNEENKINQANDLAFRIAHLLTIDDD